MKPINIKHTILSVALLAFASACDKDLEPFDSKSDEVALATPADLQTATYGAYASIKPYDYGTSLFRLGEYGGDNVGFSGTSTNTMFNVYTYTHFPDMAISANFWREAYKAIYASNRIIERIEDGTSPMLDQIKGENLYLRAFSHFNIVRLFSRPFPQGQGDNPGIVIKDNTVTDDFPARSPVKEVYDFVINDLLKAASLMTEDKSASFASREVAYALLSRVYLYKEDNENSIIYADKVFDSGRYALVDTEPYQTYFTVVPENNPETIFAIRNIIADDIGYAALGSQYYNDPVTKATGWGQTSASQAFVDLLAQYPEDARHSFIEPQRDADGNMLTRYDDYTPQYFVNKYNWQEGVPNLSSPVYLRLAEMYLNRAEANAKLGNLQEAIDDVNVIRRRAGLLGSALYTLGNLKGHTSVLDVVLEERRLELAFEAHRTYDLFRNNRSMIRAYPGTHGTDHFNLKVNPTDERVILYIPEREMNVNPNLIQNP
jgi:tetratricopeptide (TPR) repeat protein